MYFLNYEENEMCKIKTIDKENELKLVLNTYDDIYTIEVMNNACQHRYGNGRFIQYNFTSDEYSKYLEESKKFISVMLHAIVSSMNSSGKVVIFKGIVNRLQTLYGLKKEPKHEL